jgi:HAD superfamily hydrolase (TIGR01509 family)
LQWACGSCWAAGSCETPRAEGGAAIASIPLDRIETLFLDVGNTLVSIDFAWVQAELEVLGESVDPARLERAEAAARPLISRRLLRETEDDGQQLFTAYIEEVLGQLLVSGEVLSTRPEVLAAQLVPILRAPGQTQRLWSRVLPGIPEALSRLVEAGFQLVAVSNSDGTVESGLRDQDLRRFFGPVVDSALVGYEKPDRRIFEHALRVSGAEPETTLHVGDLYDADVRGARAAGIHSALLDPYDDWRHVDCQRFRDVPELQVALCAARKANTGSRG